MTWSDRENQPVGAGEGIIHTGTPVSLHADRLLSHLPQGKNRHYFLLEADCSTMSQQRIRRTDLRSIKKKFQVYYSWQNERLCVNDFGIEKFRVLFLTSKSEERFRNMIATNESIRPGHPKS